MTQEDKQLLLKDLCARLPYGVMCHIKGDDTNTSRKLSRIEVDELEGNLLDFWTDREDYLSIQVYLSDVKPYLRPMSSMTEEEKEELIKNFWGSHTAKDTFEELSWYLSKHFDINELIPRGLAIEAPKGMYGYD